MSARNLMQKDEFPDNPKTREAIQSVNQDEPMDGTRQPVFVRVYP